MFGHIPLLLGGIAQGWAANVQQRRKTSNQWWNVSQRTKKVHRDTNEQPGGAPVETYMESMFRLSEPPKQVPSKEVLNFFYENKKLFNRALKEVMGKRTDMLPTKSYWFFWSQTHPGKINEWVYFNRDTLWRLIYGRGKELPKKKR